jgi:hypothetical protein
MFAFRGVTPTGFIVTTRRARRPNGYDYVTRSAEEVLKPVSEQAKGRALTADARRGQA